ncbi:hypothetical protein [Pseudalkalibacillus berkeleyi]|uniref:Uncharacterized protein n=1 Tax=Pseudalkalibacillus berkeleyi TaxID=1069813 RepID=A0ABS9GYJ3_9BACL|nr:hypothetical protein [Pseudalkalibacillus berkeleyi]MCF6136568.1 hypothetical protein [Pseudalkalibacillus berkeleyi]
MRIRFAIVIFLIVLCTASILTNPSTESYLQFSEEKSGVMKPAEVEVERINFFLFSTYAPKGPMDHYGIVHLGFMNRFYQISEGQYDYPVWLEFFH